MIVAGHLGLAARSRSQGAVLHSGLSYVLGCNLVGPAGQQYRYAHRGERGEVLATGCTHGAARPAWGSDAQDYASHCTSLSGWRASSGKRLRFESSRLGCLVGGGSGISNK